MRVRRAAALARELGAEPWSPVEPTGRRRERFVAIGDPQASLDKFLAILAHKGLLGTDGWLEPEVHLVSIGDHFDWGGTAERHAAAADGRAILAWLAAHPPDQVSLVLGNHDLGRVGELASFDDATFQAAHVEAVTAYRGGSPDAALERAFTQKYPSLPTAEVAARDFAAFDVAQRELVRALLLAKRFRLAFSGPGDRLLVHAGLTRKELSALGLPPSEQSDARSVVAALDARLDARLATWQGEALDVPDLHRPGDSQFGEGAGMLYHRPANPDHAPNRGHRFDGEWSRRYDPRRLPPGLCQVVGHVGDAKCRELLGEWVADDGTSPGAVRHLVSDGRKVAYRAGTPSTLPSELATLVFIDGHMSRTDAAAYQLVDLRTLSPI